jgi:hypothetical protein
MNDLFPPEPEELAAIAKKRVPRVGKSTARCAADFANPAERAEFQKALQRKSEAQMQRDRILQARAAVKAATPRKARKKKEVAK